MKTGNSTVQSREMDAYVDSRYCALSVLNEKKLVVYSALCAHCTLFLTQLRLVFRTEVADENESEYVKEVKSRGLPFIFYHFPCHLWAGVRA